jgi:hypothetical protein
MLLTLDRRAVVCNGTTRRDVLRMGSLGTLGLGCGLADLQARPAAGATGSFGQARSVIFISLFGGPAHQDMFDMKPDAPAEVRGEFAPINSSVSGTSICEYLPHLAKLAHLYTQVRSVNHADNGHATGLYTLHTGWPHPRPNSAAAAGPTDYPPYGSVMSLIKPPAKPVLSYVQVGGMQGASGIGQVGGFLGRRWEPLVIQQDAHEPDFNVPELMPSENVPAVRLARRRSLLQQVNDLAFQQEARHKKSEFSTLQQRAFEMLSSTQFLSAFDIDREDTKVRDAYGRNAEGQNLLLARRLAEAGVPAIQVAWHRLGTWDTHGNNFNSLKGQLLPRFDHCLAALLADLEQRGMLDQTLVVVYGEFGRTPKINAKAGRDHWASCYTALLAGGGVRRGEVFGASDKNAAYPLSNAVGPWDVGATALFCAGVDHHAEYLDPQNRPVRVGRGEPIQGILL